MSITGSEGRNDETPVLFIEALLQGDDLISSVINNRIRLYKGYLKLTSLIVHSDICWHTSIIELILCNGSLPEKW